jgi:hypothetical protein
MRACRKWDTKITKELQEHMGFISNLTELIIIY